LALLVGGVRPGSTAVVYSFGGGPDGEYPSTDLVLDNAGVLYGTSVLGGQFGSGTVFQLTPSGDGWTHTVLYSFTSGADGAQPYGGVTLDPQGNLYGSAVAGGSSVGSCADGGCGVVYKLTPSSDGWTQTVIHAFTGGKDGSGPGGALTIDKHGNLFGMAPTGGAFGLGVIYQLRPDHSGNYVFRVIHAFTGGRDGERASAGRLLLDDAGNLYGVSTVGGAHEKGTAFELTRAPGEKWKFTTLYAFKGQPDAGFPYGGLIFDASGNLYGTTYYDGANNLGSVYQLARNPAGGWKERVLYSFAGGHDGSNSISTLVLDQAGNLLGTTSEGGTSGLGTIFKLTHGSGTWTESVEYAFSGSPDGAYAYNGMVADAAGNFYGATVRGGTDDGDGTIYTFTP
jgi:uncharacterized repeat protein (TIGR03803 family)